MEDIYIKIVNELERLDNVPVSELNTELSKLRMHFNDWEAFADISLRSVPLEPYREGYEKRKKMVDGEEYMSYKDFQSLMLKSSLDGRFFYGYDDNKKILNLQKKQHELWNNIKTKLVKENLAIKLGPSSIYINSLLDDVGETYLDFFAEEPEFETHENIESDSSISEMSIEELEALAEKNQEIIHKNDEDITKAQEEQRKAELIEKIKQQQETISKQNLTLAELAEFKPQNKEDIGINE